MDSLWTLKFELKIIFSYLELMSTTIFNKRGTELELNDTMDQAQELPEGNTWTIGNISTSTTKVDVDYFTFSINLKSGVKNQGDPGIIYTNGPPFPKYAKVEIKIASNLPWTNEIIKQKQEGTYRDDGTLKLGNDRFGWDIELIDSSGEIIKSLIVGLDDESFEILLTHGTYFIKVKSYDKENTGLPQDSNGANYGLQKNGLRWDYEEDGDVVYDYDYDKSEYAYLYDYDPIKFDYLKPDSNLSHLSSKYISSNARKSNLSPHQSESLSGTLNYSKGNDIIVLTGSGDTERGLGGDDIYLISNLIPTNSKISIVDTSGVNKIQIPDGTYIDKTLFTKNAVRLTLDDSRVITINGADNFKYNIGANITAEDSSEDLSFSDFALVFGLNDILNSSGTFDGLVSDVYVI